jgi:hypothetical protein
LKRAAVAAAAGSDKIQEAVVEKGIEVVGNAIDKQIANIEGAQNKSEAFLNNVTVVVLKYYTVRMATLMYRV